MNIQDSNWRPPPSDPVFLRKVRIAVKSATSAGDVARLRAMLINEGRGIIPHEVRGMVWMHLLRVNAEDIHAESADDFSRAATKSVNEDNSKEQILKDVVRTRPTLELFQQEHVRNALTKLLSLFCLREKVSYIQGFNELLAPFLLLDDVGNNPRMVFALYSAFVKTFAPWMLDSAETRVFEALKRAFRYFGRLLLYFDPHLFWMLDDQYMTPDIYATSWLVTVFARNFTVEATYALWDLLLLEDNALATYFFAVAMILSKRNDLMSCDEALLPEVLMSISAATVDEVHHQWRIGNDLRILQTPPSFQRLMASRLLRPTDKPNVNMQNAVKNLQNAVTVQTTLQDIMPGGGLHFFTWDCRPDEQVSMGRIAQAAYLPLDALRNAEEMIKNSREAEVEENLQNAIDMCKSLTGTSHICLLGSGDPTTDALDIHPLALRLTQEGIPCVSTLRGGFKEVLADVQSGNPHDVELVDLDLDAIKQFDDLKQKQNQQKRWASPSAFARKSSPAQVSSLTDKTDAEVREVLNSMLTSRNTGSRIPVILPNADDMLKRQTISSFFSLNQEPTDSIESGISQPWATPENFYLSTQPQQSPSTPTLAGQPFHTPETQFIQPRPQESPATPILTMGVSLEPTISGTSSVSLKSPIMSSFGGGKPPVPTTSKTTADAGSSAAQPPMEAEAPQNVEVTESLAAAKTFWGKAAAGGWLDGKSLAYPPEGLQKGFTVNIENEDAMRGLQLFPCWSDPTGSKREQSVIYVGVSKYYLVLSVPHRSTTHQLEVRVMRRLIDLRKVSFRKRDPNWMTLEFGQRGKSDETESFSVRIVDGRRDVIDLIASSKT